MIALWYSFFFQLQRNCFYLDEALHVDEEPNVDKVRFFEILKDFN